MITSTIIRQNYQRAILIDLQYMIDRSKFRNDGIKHGMSRAVLRLQKLGFTNHEANLIAVRYIVKGIVKKRG